MSTSAVTPRPQTLDQLLGAIDEARDKLAVYLPAGVDAAKFIALAKRQIAENPKLCECSSASVLRALSSAALSGLPIDGKFSTLLVRDSKHGRATATFDPTYRGLIALALSSGYVTDVQSGVVRELDHFEIEQGSEPKLVHRPCLLPKYGEMVATWAVAKLKTGGQVIEVLVRGDIERIKAMSPAREKGPWSGWADEMARKSAIRRVLKRLPAGTVRMLEGPDFAAPVPAHSPAPPLLPEEEFAIEAHALERLHDANSVGELEVAWAATLAEFSQRGAVVPLKLEARRNELREQLQDVQT